MQFSQDVDITHYSIRSYAPHEVIISTPITADLLNNPPKSLYESPKIQTQTWTRSAIITPHQLISDWPPQRFEELERKHFDILLKLNAEVVILGTGSTTKWPDSKFTLLLTENGIGFEVMDTGAACRTYNILMLEGRKVAVALLFD